MFKEMEGLNEYRGRKKYMTSLSLIAVAAE